MSASRKPRRSRTLHSVAGSSVAGSTVSSRRGSTKTERALSDAKLAKEPEPAEDVVVVHSRTEDGEGMNVVRKRGDELSLGVLRPLEEGKPLVGDVVTLKAREEHPALFDVKTEVTLPKPSRVTAGPTRVTNSSYRRGWDSLWGRRRQRPKTN